MRVPVRIFLTLSVPCPIRMPESARMPGSARMPEPTRVPESAGRHSVRYPGRHPESPPDAALAWGWNDAEAHVS